MSDIFLSYKREDQPRAEQLVRAFEAEGLTVWWDQHIAPGTRWRQTIAERLEAAPCVVVLWSRASVGEAGQFVHDEASRAARRGVYLPVGLDKVEAPLGFGQHQIIDLVGWRGDRRDARFQTLIASAKALVAGEQPPAPVAPRRPPLLTFVRNRRWMLSGGAATVAAAGAAVVLLRPSPAVAGPATLAVLPFRNLSGDAKNDYLGEGLSEELRDALARVGSIHVAARTTSDKFAKARDNAAVMARRLGLAYLLDGSVRAGGDTLRISAQLIEVKTELEKWSETFDRTADDVIAVQTGIAESVAEALLGRLSGADKASVTKSSTSVPAAYDALLQGREIFRQGGDEASYRKALALYDLAIAADPHYADAFTAKASLLTAMANQFTPASKLRSVHDAAIAAARHAVELAPESAYGQCVLGYTLAYGKLDFTAARDAFRRAFELGRHDARVAAGFGQFAGYVGMSAEGLAALNRAVSLDPLNPQIYKSRGYGLYTARKWDDALADFRHALALSPQMLGVHAAMGDIRLMQGDTPGAITEYKAEPLHPLHAAGLAIALRRSGDQAGAQGALRELQTQDGDSAAYQQGQVHAQWGEADKAFAALGRALAAGDGGLTQLRADPFMDPIRADPRFDALLKRLRFP